MPGLKYLSGPVLRREFEIGSAFTQGDLLTLETDRQCSRISGGANGVLGVALADSADSLPATKAQVLIPLPGSVFLADVPAGIAASSVSLGQTLGVYSVSGYNSYITTSYTSEDGRPFTVAGPMNSAFSKIPVEIRASQAIFASVTSQVVI